MSDSSENNKKITVSIFGSCVCRDLFAFSNSNCEVLTDIRYCSPISIASQPLFDSPIQLSDFINGEESAVGNWFRKMLCYDINKSYFSALLEKHGEYVIIDLAESRQTLLKLSRENKSSPTYIVDSSPFRDRQNLGFPENALRGLVIEKISPINFALEEWKSSLVYFCNQLTKIFKENKIIIIESMPSTECVDNGIISRIMNDRHFKESLVCKLLLPNLYKIIEDLLPNAHVIKMLNYPIGDARHKWGTHPFHFTKTMYSYLFACVEDIILKNGDNIDLISYKYQKKIESEYYEFGTKTVKNIIKNESKTCSYWDEINTSTLLSKLGRIKRFFLLLICNKKEALSVLFRRRKKRGNDSDI